MFYLFFEVSVNNSSYSSPSLEEGSGPELSQQQHCNVVLRFDLRIWKVTNDKIKTKYERLFSRDTR